MLRSDHVQSALRECGFPALARPDAVRFLGEGAWHEAYLATLPDNRQLVVRFPKAVSYGKPFVYDEKTLTGDYASVGRFYQTANQARPGICPADYHFRVSPELTYTVESYLGRNLPISEWTEASAFEIGRQLGDFFRALHEIPTELTGFGPLIWNGASLQGKLTGDPRESLRQEHEEHLEELEVLLRSPLSFDREQVTANLHAVLAQRNIDQHPITLTNRDVSPENLIFHDGRVGVIDPFPYLYSGLVFAGHLVNLYRVYFPLLHDAPRYQKHNFHLHRPVLAAAAEGYLAGYTGGDAELRRAILGESYLHLLALAKGHYELLQGEINAETVLRIGDRAALERRLPLLLRELESPC